MVTRAEADNRLDVVAPLAKSVPTLASPMRHGGEPQDGGEQQEAPTGSASTGEALCYYELAPPIADRRWSRMQFLSTLPRSAQGTVEISLPRSQVELDLYDCDNPATLVWTSKDAGKSRLARVSVADIFVARANRLLGDNEAIDTSTLMQDLEARLNTIDTPAALELLAVVDRALGHSEAAGRDLRRALAVTQSRTPIAGSDTTTLPRRADLLGELADEIRHSSQLAPAVDTYRAALSEWEHVLRGADIRANAYDYALRAVTVARLERAGAVRRGTAAAEFARVIQTRDDHAAEVVLRYLVVEGAPDLAHQAIYDTSVLSFANAPYWEIYTAVLYKRLHRELPNDLDDDLKQLRAKAGEDGEGDLSQWTSLMARALAKDDNESWVKLDKVAEGRMRFVTEATFLQALLRWAQGRVDDARAGFAKVLELQAVMMVEYSMAADALAILEVK
jgi:hypothetical protein